MILREKICCIAKETNRDNNWMTTKSPISSLIWKSKSLKVLNHYFILEGCTWNSRKNIYTIPHQNIYHLLEIFNHIIPLFYQQYKPSWNDVWIYKHLFMEIDIVGLQWPGNSSDLNLIEHLLFSIQKLVHLNLISNNIK